MSYEKEMREVAKKVKAQGIILIVIKGEEGTKLSMMLKPEHVSPTGRMLHSLLAAIGDPKSAFWKSTLEGGKEFVL